MKDVAVILLLTVVGMLAFSAMFVTIDWIKQTNCDRTVARPLWCRQ